ncbi:MAG TPA: hypothetical protein VMU89_19435 [Thermomicrobiaceae bacterium]|nr:hypothetical protein [Thermomicrobiaceae bacterium]
MNDVQADDPRLVGAVQETKDLIWERCPTASFSVTHGEGPEGTYLTAVVDVDVFIERPLTLQVDEELPLYVIPNETPERVARAYAERCRAMIAGGRSLPPLSL